MKYATYFVCVLLALILIFSCTRRERSGNSSGISSKNRIDREAPKRRLEPRKSEEKRIGEKGEPENPKQIPSPSTPVMPPRNGKFTGEEIFEKYNSAVFIVYASNGMSGGKQGSGFFVNDSCLAVSNHHVFSETTHWTVKLANGKTFNVSKIISQSEKK